jgi:3-deoxy-D-manno-octulosonic-acid transferase
MLGLYRALINFIFLISPLIIIVRIFKKKEDKKRFIEKIGFFKKKKIKGKLIWFHGASVGEIQSVIPLIDKLNKDNSINQILVTSNTLSSSKILDNFNFKKVIHQFFPIDTNFISKKFINYWKPEKAFFIDSEIWPNTLINLKKMNVPVILLNGRITKKTFKRWKYFSKLSKKVFSCFTLCLASSKQSYNFLKRLKVRKLDLIGNLKFTQSENKFLKTNSNLKKFFKNKNIWCASSTHENEEILCGKVHIKLKKKVKNLLTIIIPRHVERCKIIKKSLEKLDLKVQLENSKKNKLDEVDIFLVNSYGRTTTFFLNCKKVFLGGSLIKHGGQNPLEAARLGCKIIAGPHTYNFHEIYNFLAKHDILTRVRNENDLFEKLIFLFSNNKKIKKFDKKIKMIGHKILQETLERIDP